MFWLLEVPPGSQTSRGDLGSQIFSDLHSWFSMVTDGEFPCDLTEVLSGGASQGFNLVVVLDLSGFGFPAMFTDAVRGLLYGPFVPNLGFGLFRRLLTWLFEVFVVTVLFVGSNSPCSDLDG
ncbi:hypothetical protein Acr_00g0009820 [Actinidia rufa]|uniref:Uncharacterized protein n=1 Tax=Actinidia rufa TaxID=165716 RepID=A0A7J0DAG9_9ERIC|nr:hypothetical protein Acr_00g0009820 [Actinidia rufa]